MAEAQYLKGRNRNHLLKIKGDVSVGTVVQTSVREEAVAKILRSSDEGHSERSEGIQRLIRESEAEGYVLVERVRPDTESRVYRFGCRPPRGVNKELLEAHLFAGHSLRNDYVTVELERLEAFRQARSGIVDYQPLETDYLGLSEQLNEAQAELKAKRAKARKRIKDPELQARIKELKAKRVKAKEALDGAKALLKNDEQFQEQIRELNEGAKVKVKDLYNNSKASWGTRLLAGEAAKDTGKESKGDPKRKRWTYEGRVGVQIQGGRPTDELGPGYSKNGQFQLDPLPVDQWDTRSGRRHAYTKARLRVGTDEKTHKPIWMEFDVLLHRPLPDGLLKWAWIKVWRSGNQHHYDLQLVVASENRSYRYQPPPTARMLERLKELGVVTSLAPRTERRGTLAISLDWAATPDGGFVVATAVDDEGHLMSFMLPPDIRKRLEDCHRIQRHIDTHFNEAKDVLRRWVRVNKGSEHAPDWLVENTSHIHAWRAARKLANVAGRWTRETFNPESVEQFWGLWRDERLNGGLDLFASFAELDSWFQAQGVTDSTRRMVLYLEWWRRKNRHLFQYASNRRQRAYARRLDIYRNWAAGLGRLYDTILVDGRDFRKAARDDSPEDDQTRDYFHKPRNVVASGTLRLALKKYATVAPVPSMQGCETDGKGTVSFGRCWEMLKAAGVCDTKVRETWKVNLQLAQKVADFE